MTVFGNAYTKAASACSGEILTYHQPRLRLASVALTLGMTAGSPDIARVGEAPPGCRRRACIPQLVTAVAESAPAATALHAGSVRMTYGELIARANQLTRHLLALGVGREVPVGICLDRSFDRIVATLAVLKAGGAFL